MRGLKIFMGNTVLSLLPAVLVEIFGVGNRYACTCTLRVIVSCSFNVVGVTLES